MNTGHETMEQRLCAAFDALPQPDTGRLRVLEDMVCARIPKSRRRRVPSLAWWFAGFLILSAAGAAWWSSTQYGQQTIIDRPAARHEYTPVAPVDEAAPDTDTDAAPHDRRSPIIYRR